MKQRPNLQEFATIAGLILDGLLEHHPIPIVFRQERIMELKKIDSPTQNLESGRTFEEMFTATKLWLIQEDFIDFVHMSGHRLTTKGLAALNAMRQIDRRFYLGSQRCGRQL